MTALQPLYVDSAAASIRLEGPALVVSCPARADTRVPLRRIARVVVRGSVPIATDALLGCLGAGVPVTFVALDGQVLGYCIGRERRDGSTASLLERLLSEPAWPDLIARWTRHGESAAMLRTCRRMRIEQPLDTRPPTVRALLAGALPGGPSPGAASLLRRLEGLLHAHLAELLQRAGIPPRFRGQAASPLDLRPCFATALGWHLWPTAARLLGHGRDHGSAVTRSGRAARAASTGRRDRAVVAYEATAPLIEAEFRRMLACLEMLLREGLS